MFSAQHSALLTILCVCLRLLETMCAHKWSFGAVGTANFPQRRRASRKVSSSSFGLPGLGRVGWQAPGIEWTIPGALFPQVCVCVATFAGSGPSAPLQGAPWGSSP